MTESLKRTALYDMHVAAGAKMTPFAGYEMPVNYPPGIIKEHLHTRARAGLFDVSHMGQVRITGDDAAARLETLIPADLLSLPAGRQKYGVFTNPRGGVLDDLMVIHKAEGEYILVVNAACKDADLEHLNNHLGGSPDVDMLTDRGLLALQGPESESVLTALGADAAAMVFMDARELEIGGMTCMVTRSGYTGEDGFEISVPTGHAVELAELLIGHEAVEWTGLGARDSLRLEAGLSLYGHELTPDATPVESGIAWSLPKSRRGGGERAGGFPGAEVILPQLAGGARRVTVGLRPEGRAPVRDGAVIEDLDGNRVGEVTSGGFGPSVGGPVCMARVAAAHGAVDTPLNAVVRDRRLPAVVTRLPFTPHRYRR